MFGNATFEKQLLLLSCTMEKKINFVFAKLFTFRRYSWHWFGHNYKIYILCSVVLKSDAHTRVRHTRGKTTFELHPPQGNDACLGSGRVTVEDNDVQENDR